MQEEKDIIQNTLESEIINRLMPEVRERVIKEVDKLTENVKKNIKTIQITKPDGSKQKTTDIVHEKFDEILTLVNNNIPVMLTGGAGSGKSSTCEKVAKALRTRFLF